MFAASASVGGVRDFFIPRCLSALAREVSQCEFYKTLGRDGQGEVLSCLCLSILGLWWATVLSGGSSSNGTVARPSLEGRGSLRVRLLVVVRRVSGRCSCSCHGTSCHTCPWRLWVCSLRDRPNQMLPRCRCNGFGACFAMVIDSVEPIVDPRGFCLVGRGVRASS